MDDARFDRLTRTLGRASRRPLLGGMLATIIGFPLVLDEATARRKRRNDAKRRVRKKNKRHQEDGSKDHSALEGVRAEAASSGRKVVVFISGVCSQKQDPVFKPLRNYLTDPSTPVVSTARASGGARDIHGEGKKKKKKKKKNRGPAAPTPAPTPPPPAPVPQPRGYGFNTDTDFLYFSYDPNDPEGGSVTCPGGIPYWNQNPYDKTAPASTPIDETVNRLHNMLLSYRERHMDATFFLVGHSLGGFIAFKEILKAPAGLIEAVITIDSPLHGAVPLPQELRDAAAAVYGDAACLAQGAAIDTLLEMGWHPGDTADSVKVTASAAAAKGIRLVTMGNEADCLYNPGLCLLCVLCAGADCGRCANITNTPWTTEVGAVAIQKSFARLDLFSDRNECLNPNPFARFDCINATHTAFLDEPTGLEAIAAQIGRQNPGAAPAACICAALRQTCAVDQQCCGYEYLGGTGCYPNGCDDGMVCSIRPHFPCTSDCECMDYVGIPFACKRGKCYPERCRFEGSTCSQVSDCCENPDTTCGASVCASGVCCRQEGKTCQGDCDCCAVAGKAMECRSGTCKPATSDYEFVAKWGSTGAGPLQLNSPEGLAVDGAGNVYVADSENHRIVKYSGSGSYITSWGSFGTGNGQFDTPTDVTVDSSGTVYVVDHWNDRIQKFNSSGTFLAKWGTSGVNTGQFWAPIGIAVDVNSNVFVADGKNERIQKFSSTGTFLATWGSRGAGNSQFSGLYGVAVDSAGNVYVADALNKRIQKFSGNGVFLGKWGTDGIGPGQFKDLSFIAVDSANNVFVTDTAGNRIQKFSNTGSFLTSWGSYGVGNGQFDGPDGIAVDAGGNVFVSDISNNRIQKFAPGGVGRVLGERTPEDSNPPREGKSRREGATRKRRQHGQARRRNRRRGRPDDRRSRGDGHATRRQH